MTLKALRESKQDYVRHCLGKGMDRDEIAANLNITRKTLDTDYISAMRRSGLLPPVSVLSGTHGSARERVGIYLDRHAMAYFQTEAEKRKTTIGPLLRDLCETVAKDSMVNAVLDDAP